MEATVFVSSNLTTDSATTSAVFCLFRHFNYYCFSFGDGGPKWYSEDPETAPVDSLPAGPDD